MKDADAFLERAEADLSGWADPQQRLARAVENDEFCLYCQPILALGAGAGYPFAEVLVRMRQEEAALLPPGDFFPAFEHYRMLPQLDRWVLRHTLKAMASGSRIERFTINLSGQTLEDRQFAPFVATQLAAHGVPAAAVFFEIDESDTLRRLAAAEEFAAAYRAIGGNVMVDAFGRRSVSFAAVKALAPAFLKVDGSIIRKLLTSESAQKKMNALLSVARALGFGLIAEFVEENDVLLRLRALGVGYAQGFGVYQPQPLESFAKARVHGDKAL